VYDCIISRRGKPTQNAFIESFNGKFRDECLNESSFASLQKARDLIESWRTDYNEQRPHRSLGQLTPNAFAATQLDSHTALHFMNVALDGATSGAMHPCRILWWAALLGARGVDFGAITLRDRAQRLADIVAGFEDAYPDLAARVG
jgi:hypothetical protein